ncbi:MAG: hypothetical protein R2939_06635 [Kofleriaceae bacterium]
MIRQRNLRTPFVLLGGVSLLAACTGGERNRTGECPADEQCSPLTPDGLHFVGAELHDLPVESAPFSTAVGGTQVVRLLVDDDNLDLDPGGGVRRVDLDGDALEVVSTASASVTVGGVGAGTDYLRITEAGTPLLLDRIVLDAGPVAEVAVVPPGIEAYDAAAPLAFLAGEITVGLALTDAGARRLIDQGLAATVAGVAADARAGTFTSHRRRRRGRRPAHRRRPALHAR